LFQWKSPFQRYKRRSDNKTVWASLVNQMGVHWMVWLEDGIAPIEVLVSTCARCGDVQGEAAFPFGVFGILTPELFHERHLPRHGDGENLENPSPLP
jgi:hypothetical protein